MDKIVILSNGIKLGIIGNVYPVMFEDDTILSEWDNGNPYNVEGSTNLVTVINGKTMLINDVTLGLADWVKIEITNFIQAEKRREVDLLICNPALIQLVYEYINLYYSDVDIYTLDIIEDDSKNELEIARLNLFLRYTPNLI
jgi:hypothetical protein